MSCKLLFVVNTDSFFMSHRWSIARAALQQGFEVHVAAGLMNDKDKMQALGLTVHPLSMSRHSTNVFSNGSIFFQILRIFIRVRPDVVHLVTIKPVIWGGIAARLVAVPCAVAAIPGLGFIFISHGIRAKIRRWFVGRLYRFAFGHRNLKVIFQNEHDRATLIKLVQLPKKKTGLIRGSGVDLEYYFPSPFPQRPPVVILAARLLADKGVREFVQAARVLKEDGNRARFVLVGDFDPGSSATISDNELKRWVSEGVVEWWGHHYDMPRVFACSCMVVLPSYYGEGLPKVLIEAAACGRAVITTDHPGCRDAIEPGVTGILVPIHDSAALMGAMKRLLDDFSLCEKMGRAGRKLAERSFDVRQVIAQHMHIYEELLQQVT